MSFGNKDRGSWMQMEGLANFILSPRDAPSTARVHEIRLWLSTKPCLELPCMSHFDFRLPLSISYRKGFSYFFLSSFS